MISYFDSLVRTSSRLGRYNWICRENTLVHIAATGCVYERGYWGVGGVRSLGL
jgi:hypothetical protein